MDEIIIRIKGKKAVRLCFDEHMEEWVPCLLPQEKAQLTNTQEVNQ